MPLNEQLSNLSGVARIVFTIAIMLIAGFAATRLTKRLRLPNVTGYILAGIVIGPFALNIIPLGVAEGMDFIADISLAFIAFSAGEFFSFDVLRKHGFSVALIALMETLLASALIFFLTYFVLRLGLVFSIVLAALASVTAPTSTIMTIRQTGAKGDFVEILLQTIALDDVIGLIAYSVAISLAQASMFGSFKAADVFFPVLSNIGFMCLGGLFGVFMKALMPKGRSTDNRLIIAIALLLSFCGVCALLDVSPLLGCMAMGAVYINIADDEKLFKQLNYFSPPILLLFFVRSGVVFRLDKLFDGSSLVGSIPLMVIVLLYLVVRFGGKYIGSFLGCLLVRTSPGVRNNLGLALLPQAGVAIGLSVLCAREIGGDIGDALQTVILATSILYELVGPPLAKLSLFMSHSYSNKLEELTDVVETKASGEMKTPLEILTERIQQIQKELPVREASESAEESAFDEAAEAQYEAMMAPRRNNFLRNNIRRR